MSGFNSRWGVIQDLKQEIERLRKAQNQMLAVQAQQAKYLREKTDEIEKLLSLLREALEVTQPVDVFEPATEWYRRVREALNDE